MFTQHPRPTTLNAIPPIPADDEQAERRARHLAICHNLIDMGAELARRAYHRALMADEQATAAHPSPKPTDDADPNLTYHRHASGVRQTMALENRIAANAWARSTQATPEPSVFIMPEGYTFTDPDEERLFWPLDHGNLCEAVYTLTCDRPDWPEFKPTVAPIVEQDLIANPDDHLSASFDRICAALNIAPDRTRLEPHIESQLRYPLSRHPNPH